MPSVKSVTARLHVESNVRLGYKAIPAERGQLSWSQTGLQPKPSKGEQGGDQKCRHNIPGTHARTRPGFWCLLG